MIVTYRGTGKVSIWPQRRWSLRFGEAAPLEQLVLWRALFYALSFVVTRPIALVVYVTGWDFYKETMHLQSSLRLWHPCRAPTLWCTFGPYSVAFENRDFVGRLCIKDHSTFSFPIERLAQAIVQHKEQTEG